MPPLSGETIPCVNLRWCVRSKLCRDAVVRDELLVLYDEKLSCFSHTETWSGGR